MNRLSKNFLRSEFACKGTQCCNNSAPVHPDLIIGLQELRDRIGFPIIITSGFRCNKHNQNVGGEGESFHALGMAADIFVRNFPLKWVAITASEIEVFKKGGIGLYDNFIHLDVRGRKARWGF